MKRATSMKSVRSMKSAKSRSGETLDVKKTLDIEECLQYACARFNCPCDVVVVKENQRDEFYRSLKKAEAPVKYKKITLATPSEGQSDDSELNIILTSQDKKLIKDIRTIIVLAIYDNMNHLVELVLPKVRALPRVLMQIIRIIGPHFQHLNKMSITRSRIDKYTIFELNKLIKLSTITEVCLDESPIPEGNYAILLGESTCLRCLSLSRCLINDDVCKQIFARLHYLEPAETTLVVLNLSSNHITDEGAQYIEEALRTNRNLRYLNLADNRIGDDGAGRIFDTLVEFPLTCEEILDKRHRYSEYLRTKRAMYAKFLNESDSKSMDEYSSNSRKSTSCKKKANKPINPVQNNKGSIKRGFTDDYAAIRAETMAEELVGPYRHPFSPDHTNLKDDYSHCVGNFILCYLNLSYNNLSYISVKKLLAVVKYQQIQKMKSGHSGIMKILIDGNYMPVSCVELSNINDILQRQISCFGSRSLLERASRRKSAKTSVISSKNILE